MSEPRVIRRVRKSRGSRREALDLRKTAQTAIKRASTFYYFAAALGWGGVLLLLTYGYLGGVAGRDHDQLFRLVQQSVAFGVVMLVTGMNLHRSPAAWSLLAATAETARFFLLTRPGVPALTWIWFFGLIWLALLWAIAGRMIGAHRVLRTTLSESGEPPVAEPSARDPSEVVVERRRGGMERQEQLQVFAVRRGVRRLATVYHVIGALWLLPALGMLYFSSITIGLETFEEALSKILFMVGFVVYAGAASFTGSRIERSPLRWSVQFALFDTARFSLFVVLDPTALDAGRFMSGGWLLIIWLLVVPANSLATRLRQTEDGATAGVTTV